MKIITKELRNIPVNIRITKEEMKKLMVFAEKQSTTVSSVIRIAIIEYLKKKSIN